MKAFALFRAIISICFISALLAGCFSLGGMGAESAEPGLFDSGAEGGVAPKAAYADTAAAAEPAPSAARSGALSLDTDVASAQAQDGTGETPEPQRRLRIYSGYLDLIVDDVEKQRENIIELTKSYHGYVESTSAEYIVIRVPAESFESLFEDVGELGEILQRFIETADVTELFQDLELRLEAARKTRARLQDLLEKTTDVDERVKILKEIRRLTEEIDRIESSLEHLAGRIRLSRITVRLVPRIDGSGQGRRTIPFRWIAGLKPLTPSVGVASRKIELAIDENFAVLASGETVRAESAEGTRFRMGGTANKPKGDSIFWRKALQFHLTALYRSSEKVDADDFLGVLFESKDTSPFYYLVAVRTAEEEILVAEAFFPNGDALDRRLDPVLEMLKGVENE